jgi:type IV pilus assembly protein PilE
MRVSRTFGAAVGFSLIELMVAVSIVAILAAIAYPSYLSHMAKSRRASAQAALMDVAQRQQQYLLDARGYAPDLDTLMNTPINTWKPPPDVDPYYNVTMTYTAGPPPKFTATATPKGVQASDFTLSIDSVGVKLPAGKW